VHGEREAHRGEEFLSTWVRLSTERVGQAAVEDEQAVALGRARSDRREGQLGARTGSERGTLKTAAGVLRVPVPQIRGREEPSRSELWSPGAKPREVRKRLR